MEFNISKTYIPKSSTIYLLIFLSVCLHLFFFIAAHTFLAGWVLEHYPIHGAIEFGGALISLWVALMLIFMERSNLGTSFNIPIACALIVMGILDAFHALTYAGHSFVFLHSLATFLGGLVFSTIWLSSLKKIRSIIVVYGVLLFAILLGVLINLFPQSVPAMLNDEGFTLLAKLLNITGGLCFIIAANKLFFSYQKTKNTDDLLFCLHCILFAAASIMFEQSQLWDVSWWGWHILRFLAYLVALLFIVLTERNHYQYVLLGKARAENLQKELEKRVGILTEELNEQNLRLKETVSQLEIANEELNYFSYVAPHDLQSPLNNISDLASLLQEDIKEQNTEAIQANIEYIQITIKRMKQLIQDLLIYSKIGQTELQKELVSCRSLVNDVQDILATTLHKKNVQLHISDLPEILGAPALLRQLFQNIIENGIKYNESKPPAITLSAKEDEHTHYIFISDNGIGIEERHLERIFKPFERLHSYDTYKGTGIGLASCVRIMEKHHGKLTVSSTVNKGTTFTLAFPK